VLFSISTFISYDIKRATEAAACPPEGPFPTPARNRAAIENALVSTTLGVALGIVVLASALFFIIPRYRTGYLTGMGMQAQNITGFTETVNLGDIRQILQSNAVVMRVKVLEGGPRAFQGIKWRGVALTSFDGRHWYNDNTEQFPLSPVASTQQPGEWDFRLPRQDGRPTSPRRPLQYRILLTPLSTDVLFVAAVPRVLTGHLRLINLDETDSVHNPQHGYSPVAYDVISDTGTPSPADLRRASADYPSDIRLVYLSLPSSDLRITELAEQLTKSAGNNYDRALAIENYLRTSFGYTLNPRPSSRTIPSVASCSSQSRAIANILLPRWW